MESAYLDFEFIQNREIVAAVCAEIRALGLLVICDGCDHIEAGVAGFLLSEARKEAWPLCVSCARKLGQFAELSGHADG